METTEENRARWVWWRLAENIGTMLKCLPRPITIPDGGEAITARLALARARHAVVRAAEIPPHIRTAAAAANEHTLAAHLLIGQQGRTWWASEAMARLHADAQANCRAVAAYYGLQPEET